MRFLWRVSCRQPDTEFSQMLLRKAKTARHCWPSTLWVLPDFIAALFLNEQCNFTKSRLSVIFALLWQFQVVNLFIISGLSLISLFVCKQKNKKWSKNFVSGRVFFFVCICIFQRKLEKHSVSADLISSHIVNSSQCSSETFTLSTVLH